MIRGKTWSFRTPDLDAMKGGRRYWIEVKTKAHAVLNNSAGEYRHGIDRPCWNDYVMVAKESGTPVWIIIYEELSGDILAASTEELQVARFQLGGVRGYGNQRGGMIFWARSAFREIGNMLGYWYHHVGGGCLANGKHEGACPTRA